MCNREIERMNSEERKANRQRWRAVIEQWQQSDLTKVDFCRENELSEKRFHYYYRRLVREPAREAGFAQVSLNQSGSGLRLRLNQSLELDIQPGFDEATLKRFLSAVISLC